jgi:hypothetical protein
MGGAENPFDRIDMTEINPENESVANENTMPLPEAETFPVVYGDYFKNDHAPGETSESD